MKERLVEDDDAQRSCCRPAGGLAAPAPADDAMQGGSIVVTYKDDMSTLDPGDRLRLAELVDDQLAVLAPDGLQARHDRTRARPLPRATTISPDGLTYTFKLIPGRKFHNGRELTADDVKYWIDRTVNPKTQGPGRRASSIRSPAPTR